MSDILKDTNDIANTTISISWNTRNRLLTQKKRGESFEDTLIRILKSVEDSNLKERNNQFENTINKIIEQLKGLSYEKEVSKRH